MSITFLVLGFGLIGVGLLFAFGKIGAAETKAGSERLNIQAPAWMLLVVLGVASLGYGSWLGTNGGDTSQPVKTTPTSLVEPTIPPIVSIAESLFPNGFTFGDDNALDKLWRECGRGLWSSCDELYFQSDIGSDYEWFGATCGGIIEDPVDFCDPDTE